MHITQCDKCVCNRRILSPEVVTCGSRVSARTLRANSKRTPRINNRDTAATGTNRNNIGCQ